MKPSLQTLLRFTVTAIAVIAAVAAGRWLWSHYQEEPWTRDGRLRADVLQVAPDVSGPVSSVEVRDNQEVRRGQVLFIIDRSRFELALKQAEADVASRQSELGQAQRDASRNRALGDIVSKEWREQGRTRVDQAQAALNRAVANRDLAALELERTVIRSPTNGTVTNLLLQEGDYATAGRQVVAVVDRDSFRVEGYFEETKLSRIHVGDPVSVHIMGEDIELHGVVESIAAGIEDRDRTSGPSLLPDVNPTFSWVRLAQRVPVRVKLGEIPPGLRMVAGRTATVRVHPRGPGADGGAAR